MSKFENEFKEVAGLSVKVDDVIYMPNLEAPADRPHPFVYFISIINQSQKQIRILGRKWVICQANNEWIVVEGDGVVNQEPVIKPGDEFTYNSYHVIGDDSRATGSFFGEAEDGSLVMVRIPDFELKIPQWAEKS